MRGIGFAMIKDMRGDSEEIARVYRSREGEREGVNKHILH